MKMVIFIVIIAAVIGIGWWFLGPGRDTSPSEALDNAAESLRETADTVREKTGEGLERAGEAIESTDEDLRE